MKNIVKKRIVAIIPARGGSKRLHRKNIRDVAGQPMIYYAIKACKDSNYNIECYVSTEDSEIAKIAENCDAKVYKRPKDIADDLTFKQDVIVDAIQNIFLDREKPDIVISVQPNSPEILGVHLDEAIELKNINRRKEIFTVDNNLMQNGVFRVMDYDYVFLKTLSMYCGVYVCDITDVHTEQDLLDVNKKIKNRTHA